MSPHISIKGETVFYLAGFPVTNSFLSSVIVVIVFFFIGRYYYQEIKKSDRSLVFYALHGLFKGMYDMFRSVLQDKIKIFYTLLGGFFFFILMNNWSGLVPGVGSILIKEPHKAVIEELKTDYSPEEGTIVMDEQAEKEETATHNIPLLRGGTADLNTTLALALVSVFLTQFYGFKFLGPKKHLSKYFNFKDPIMIMLGPLEIIQEAARIISFSFRLYGNIFAGEVLLTIVPFLLPSLFSFVVAPMFFMEIFVGGVQALVFVMLSAVFINMAIVEHH